MQGECERGETPVPDLSNLDTYYDIGIDIIRENREFDPPASYRQRYIDRLRAWDAFSPLPHDTRLWTADIAAGA